MKRVNKLSFSLLCLIVVFSLTVSISPSAEASPGTIYVPDDCPAIQEAVDDAILHKGKNAKVLFLMDGSITVPVDE